MAKRFADLRGLRPAIDVFLIAKELAHTEFIEFPSWANSDGLTLDVKVPRRRPQIYINSRIGHHRQRFTAAHEIGHIVIPWHIGDIVDDLSAADDRANSRYRRMEAEANRFAAELLMPQEWITDLCGRVDHLRGAVLTIAEVSDVSLSAAALRVIQFGPAGYIVAHAREDVVTLIGQTVGTRASLPEVGLPVRNLKFSAFHEPEIFGGGSSVVFVWKERDQLVPPDCPPGDWRATLASMLTIVPDDRRKAAHAQINAIVGFRIGKHPKGTPVDVIYKDVTKAFENRSDRNRDIVDLRRHQDFDAYLLGRIYERAQTGSS